MRAFILAASLLAMPAFAQDGKVWTPAPVSGAGAPQTAPADRAGAATTADLGAPFAAMPTGAVGGSGRSGPSTVGTTSSTATTTPNVSK